MLWGWFEPCKLNMVLESLKKGWVYQGVVDLIPIWFLASHAAPDVGVENSWTVTPVTPKKPEKCRRFQEKHRKTRHQFSQGVKELFTVVALRLSFAAVNDWHSLNVFCCSINIWTTPFEGSCEIGNFVNFRSWHISGVSIPWLWPNPHGWTVLYELEIQPSSLFYLKAWARCKPVYPTRKRQVKRHSVLESLKVSAIFFTSKIGSRLAGYLGFGGDVDYVSR